MSLIKGKVVKFSFGGSDVPFKSCKVDESYKKVDVTDNSSVAVENALLRQTVKLELSGVITKTGTKQVGKNLALTFNSVAYKTTDLSYEQTFSEFETTHGGTSGDATEYDVDFAEQKMTATIWKEDSQADIPQNSSQAATLQFASGVTAAGNLIIESLSSEGEVKGDVKMNVAGFFNAAVTETNLGLTGGTSAAAVVTYADGTTTDKATSGTAILTSKKISTTKDGDVQFTYSFVFTGAVAKTDKASA